MPPDLLFQPRIRLARPAPPAREEARRGVLLHRFVQERARAPFDAEAAWAWLRREGRTLGLSEETLAGLPVPALTALPSRPEFRFLQKGRPEVSVFDGDRLLRLDSLYVDETRAVIIEIKTGEHLAQGALPEAYCAQIAAYRRVVQEIFPGRLVAAFLLETETAQFLPFEA